MRGWLSFYGSISTNKWEIHQWGPTGMRWKRWVIDRLPLQTINILKGYFSGRKERK
jgi:hypothetical protein